MVWFISHRIIKSLYCIQDTIIRPLLDVFLHLHVNYVKLTTVQKRLLHQMGDHSDPLWWFWCFLLMSIYSRIKVTLGFILIQKLELILKYSLLIPSESISPTFGADQDSAILHQVVKVSVSSFVAHRSSFRPAGQKYHLPRSGLGIIVNLCCSSSHSLCSAGWALLMSVWRKSGQGLHRLKIRQ